MINVYRETEASLATSRRSSTRPGSPARRSGGCRRAHALAFESVSFFPPHGGDTRGPGRELRGAPRGDGAFVGPREAGKTTLVKLLGPLPAAARAILYDGQAHDRIDLEKLREPHRLRHQDTQLFSGSIRENLLFVRPARPTRSAWRCWSRGLRRLLARADAASTRSSEGR